MPIKFRWAKSPQSENLYFALEEKQMKAAANARIIFWRGREVIIPRSVLEPAGRVSPLLLALWKWKEHK